LAFALKLRENHGKTSIRVEKPQSGYKNLSQSSITIIFNDISVSFKYRGYTNEKFSHNARSE